MFKKLLACYLFKMFNDWLHDIILKIIEIPWISCQTSFWQNQNDIIFVIVVQKLIIFKTLYFHQIFILA